MLRLTLITGLLCSLIPTGEALANTVAPALYAQATPQTVQVERGGAEIYTQPESSAQVIGQYRAGVVLTPKLRLFNPEGQAWLRVGDHWIAEESVTVLEGQPSPSKTPTATKPPATRPTPIDLKPPAAPIQPSQAPKPSSQPTQKKPQGAASSPAPQPKAAPQTKPQAAAKPQAKPKATPKAKPKTATASKGAVLVTKDPKAQVNVRTATNTQSDVIHAGKPGDQVQILKSQAGEGGYTWYQVKFPTAKVQGWVRGDFIKLGSQ